MVIIRELTITDVEEYRTLKRISLLTDPMSFSNHISDELKKSDSEYITEIESVSSGNFILGAFTENILVGFLKFERDTRKNALHKAMLHTLFIKQECRRMNIGSLLLQELLIIARNLECLEQIHIWVLQHTQDATRFYLKNGFVPQGTMVKKDLIINGEYVDSLYMVLTL